MPYKDPTKARAARQRYEQRKRQEDPQGRRNYWRERSQAWRERNPERWQEVTARYRERNRTTIRDRDRWAKSQYRQQQRHEALLRFRSFVAALPDYWPQIEPSKREQRRQLQEAIHRSTVGRTYLESEPNPAVLTARPRNLWRRLSRRGLPLNYGAR